MTNEQVNDLVAIDNAMRSDGRGAPRLESITTTSGMVVNVAEPDAPPRATVYALHGGGLTGRYWDCPFDPSLSLVHLATSLGFRVVFPDRPGHGANAARWPSGLPAAHEAALHLDTISGNWGGDPLLLVGQSAGAIVALHAASTQPADLIGLDYSGIGITIDLDRMEIEDSRLRFWGPSSLYPVETFESVWRITVPTTEEDGISSMTLGDRFHSLAAQVRAPVRVTFADHEGWWGDIDGLLVEVPKAFTHSSSVDAVLEYGAGHNLSVGYAARAYHLAVMAFAERCLRRTLDGRRSER